MLKFIWNHLTGIGMFLSFLVGPTALYALLVRSFEISWEVQRVFLLSMLIPVLVILIAALMKLLKNN